MTKAVKQGAAITERYQLSTTLLLPATGHILAAGSMAITAIHGGYGLSDIRGMLKFRYSGAWFDIFLLLTQNRVAKIAILGNNLACG